MDYKELGLRAGLECHQQLNTKKLFCNCKSELQETKGDFKIKRKLRPVASETGDFDKAALQEFNKGREYIYDGYKDKICLVELDEEPPHEINQDALNATLEVALKTNSEIYDIAFVMRKIVIDGSNTSGFQRTAKISQNGFLELGKKKVSVASICLEEDASQNLESNSNFINYGLDRLGIPLIEFTTEPDLNTPEEVKKCAEKIGELFRITGKAKRGLGSIRQDVNVSIAKGQRVEIKGVQYLDLIDKYVENEVSRQIVLLETKEYLIKNKLKDKLKFEMFDVTKELAQSESNKIIESINKGQVAYAIPLVGFKGILGKETMPGKRVGSEISGYVKAKTKALGLFHIDELPKYGITQKNVDDICKKLLLGKQDGFIIIVQEKAVAEQALKVAFDRVLQLFEGVLEETRNPLPDGTTEYSRPLPGASRMYPETDVPVIDIKKETLQKLSKDLPRWYDERISYYKKFGLNEQISGQVAKSNYARIFTKLVDKYNPLSLAELFVLLPEVSKVENYLWLLDEEKKGTITKKEFKIIIDGLQKGKSKDEILNSLKKSELDVDSKKIIDDLLKKNKDFIKTHHNPVSAMMGSVMKALQQNNKKPDMKQLSQYLEEEIKKMN